MREFDLIAVLDGTHIQPPMPGLQMVQAAGLTAVLSGVPRPLMRLPQSRATQLGETATHLTWQEACMARTTILPARQGCGLSLDGAAGFLVANHPILQANLTRFAGRTQLQITVSWKASEVLKRFCHEPELAPVFARTSVTAQDLTAAITALAQRLGRIIGDGLDQVAEDVATLPLAQDVLWNGALLVPAAALADLDAAVEAVDAIWPEGLQIRQIGPTPISSFALIEAEPVSTAQISSALGRLGLRGMPDATMLAAARRQRLLETPDAGEHETIRRAAQIVGTAARLPDPGKGLILCHIWAEGQATSQPVPTRAVA
jgi:hypothetical protein